MSQGCVCVWFIGGEVSGVGEATQGGTARAMNSVEGVGEEPGGITSQQQPFKLAESHNSVPQPHSHT